MLDLDTDQFKHASVLCPQADLDVDEKRSSPRFPWSAEIALTLLPNLESAARAGRVLIAEAENVAKGGIGMLCDRPLAPGTVVRCDIALLNEDVYIPTLLKVRWNHLAEDKKKYRLGLEYLI
jgi:hypothetical protein